MDILSHLALGFGEALSPLNLGFCLLGVLIGTLIGVLPGLGPTATIAMLLPLTFSLPASAALIMLAGIYYGAQYGGSTTAILVNLPGESSSVITCLDGHKMAQQGRAGAALATAALASFFAGTVATLIIALFAPPLTKLAQQFGAAEYFSLMTLGLLGAVVLSNGSVLRAIMVILLGLLLGLIGSDVNSGLERMTLGFPQLSDGLDFVPLGVGIFGISEIIRNLRTPENRTLLTSRISGLMPRWSDLKQAFPAMARGTALGSLLGILPGGGATLSAFSAYALEKKVARDPSRFGKGAIEGIAGPEAANNAGAQTSFIPLLTLGIPENAVMALMAGAMIMQGIQPSPRVIVDQPVLFWGIITSMWIGNLMLVIINLPLIGVWVSLLKVPYRLLAPLIILTCAVGVFSVNNSTFDILLMVVFGLLGYFLMLMKCEPAPLVLGFILGPMMEENLRRALLLSRGSYMTFIERPISLGLLVVCALLLASLVIPAIRSKRKEAFEE